MKLDRLFQHLTEEERTQERKDLLLWQEKLIDVFPESYDISLETRAPYKGVAPFNVVTVSRNGKELFYFDTRQSSIKFFSSMGVCGENIRAFSIGTEDLQKSVNELMTMYELRRKLSNLLSAAECVISKYGKTNNLTVEVQHQNSKFDRDAIVVEYKSTITSFYVKVTRGVLATTEIVGTTKMMTKAIDLVEKEFKALEDK
jgi:hypothetical protein